MRTLAIGLTVFGLAAAVSQAQTAKIGVINIQSAIVTTKDGQKAAADLESKAAPRRKTLEAKQNEINGLKDQLQKGQNALSESAKQDLVRNIDAKTKSFNRDMEDASAEFDAEQQRVLQDLGGRIMAVINKYATDNGYSLIVDVSSPQTPVLFASPAIDVTKDIIDLYDKNAGGPATTTAAPRSATPAATRPATPAARPAPATTAPRPGTSK